MTSNIIKEEPLELKEEAFDDYADIKQEEPIAYSSDEFKEEPLDFKEEPFDDFTEIKMEDLIFNPSVDFKDEPVEIKEETFDEFADVKQEEPIDYEVNTLDDKFMEFKEDPIDFVDVKEEAWPIADVFCPSTGDSRTLNVDLDEELNPENVVESSRPTMMMATKTIAVKGSVRVTRDAVIRFDRNRSFVESFPSAAFGVAQTSIQPKRPRINLSISSGEASNGSLDEFAEVKQEEPMALTAINDPSKEIKEESNDIKEEEPLTLPIADVFCPSTGNSRHLNIDLGEGMNPDSMVAPIAPKRLFIAEDTTGSQKVRSLSDCILCNSLQGAAKENHARLVHPELFKREPKKCTFCNSWRFEGYTMENHLRSMHSDVFKRDSKKCSFCDAYYTKGAAMDNHVRSKHPEECKKALQRQLTKCAFCDSFHLIGVEMANHVRSMHLDKFKRTLIKCSFCDDQHTEGAAMDNHIRTMHDHQLNRQLMECDFCDSLYPAGTKMENHVRSTHPGRLKRSLKQCSFCDYVCIEGFQMSYHVRSMHELTRGIVTHRKCCFCNIQFAVGSAMEKHLQFMHPDQLNRLSKCNFCDALCSEGLAMEHHVRSMHPGKEKKFEIRKYKRCNFCLSAHTMGADLENHVRSNHPVEFLRVPKKCKFCFVFHILGVDMEIHVRAKHPEEYQSYCAHQMETKSNSGFDGAMKQFLLNCCFCKSKINHGQTYFLSPNISDVHDWFYARRFFGNLIELTPEQRHSAERFLQSDLRARICGKHIKNFMEDHPNCPKSKIYNDGVQVKKTQ